MAATDPNPNIRTADRGGLSTIASAVTATTGYAFSGTTLPASTIAYGRVPNNTGTINPNAFFQVDFSAGTATGQFLGSNDLLNWYNIGDWNAAGAWPIGLAAGYRYISASIDTIGGGASVTISAAL